MHWSLRIGRVRGIGIYVHWTFLILIGWVVLSHYFHDQDMQATLKGVGFVLAIFGCVLLHELGHALAAQRFQIQTKDITLLPIGGLARLERMPEDPMQEFWVAIAGPLVNVGIALILFLVLLVQRQASFAVPLNSEEMVRGSFLSQLMLVNVMLVLFNLLPAFPMDGGRVLRALLATRMDYVHATQIAANVGQFMAILFGFYGLFNNPFLLFIALFVYIGAQEEANAVHTRWVFRGIPVRNAMITRFRTLSESDPLSVAVDELLAGTQQDFPVMHESKVIGVLHRADLIRAIAEGGTHRQVSEIMQRDCPSVEENDMLDVIVRRMRDESCPTMPVTRADKLVGMINLENLGEYYMIQTALRESRRRSDVDNVFRPSGS